MFTEGGDRAVRQRSGGAVGKVGEIAVQVLNGLNRVVADVSSGVHKLEWLAICAADSIEARAETAEVSEDLLNRLKHVQRLRRQDAAVLERSA